MSESQINYTADPSKPRKFYIFSDEVKVVIAGSCPKTAAIAAFARAMQAKYLRDRQGTIFRFGKSVIVSEAGYTTPLEARKDGAELKDPEYDQLWKKAHAADVQFSIKDIVTPAMRIVEENLRKMDSEGGFSDDPIG